MKPADFLITERLGASGRKRTAHWLVMAGWLDTRSVGSLVTREIIVLITN